MFVSTLNISQRGSLATGEWGKASYLVENLAKHNHRIAANEWDCFFEEHAEIRGAVLATTIRHPIDRWFSQYRFTIDIHICVM